MFHQPDYAITIDRIMKAREELIKTRLKERILQHIAARNEIFHPYLIKNVHGNMEIMLSSLHKFYSSSAFREVRKEMDNPNSTKAYIPCHLCQRKDLLEVFENLEKINSIKLSLHSKLDCGKVEEHVKDSMSKLSEFNTIDKLTAHVKSNSKLINELMISLDKITKLREKMDEVKC